MIIFYQKSDGKIIGTIEGRIHNLHMNMWIGNKEEIDRLIFNWEKNEQDKYEPVNKEQKEIIIAIDKNPISIYDYKIDTNSLKLVKL